MRKIRFRLRWRLDALVVLYVLWLSDGIQDCMLTMFQSRAVIAASITTNEASDLMGQIRALKDKVERLMI